MQPMQFCDLTLGEDLHELTVFGTPMFPCIACDEDFDQYVTGVLPWHWHEEIELIYMCGGAMQIACGEASYTIAEGDAVFINSNILHTARRAPGAPCCRINSILFKAELISGFPYSVTAQSYLAPLRDCRALASVPLSQSAGWQKEMIEHFRAAFCAYTSDAYGSEMRLQAELTGFLYLLVANNASVLAAEQAAPDKNALRTRQMLSFIHAHFDEPLSVAQIAAAAAVSESECTRCFKKVLHTSPIDYLNAYRIRIAAGLLAGTEQSISEICAHTGFNGPSYFAKTFRQIMQCSPRAYRIAQAAAKENPSSAE